LWPWSRRSRTFPYASQKQKLGRFDPPADLQVVEFARLISLLRATPLRQERKNRGNDSCANFVSGPAPKIRAGASGRTIPEFRGAAKIGSWASRRFLAAARFSKLRALVDAEAGDYSVELRGIRRKEAARTGQDRGRQNWTVEFARRLQINKSKPKKYPRRQTESRTAICPRSCKILLIPANKISWSRLVRHHTVFVFRSRGQVQLPLGDDSQTTIGALVGRESQWAPPTFHTTNRQHNLSCFHEG
jgi:hypothetical protein